MLIASPHNFFLLRNNNQVVCLVLRFNRRVAFNFIKDSLFLPSLNITWSSFLQNGENYRCGNPLAKDYINKIEDGTLVASGDHSAHNTLIINKMISSWRNAQKRVRCGDLILSLSHICVR